jgi:RNA polymerase sigma-70 factor (ECF subfamily)
MFRLTKMTASAAVPRPTARRRHVQTPAERAPGSGVSAVVAASRPGRCQSQIELLERLRSGDRAAFAELVDNWSPVLLRVALLYVSTRPSAEEIVQETWLAVIAQLDQFEGRSSVKTWVFRILETLARTRGERSPALPAPRDPNESQPTVDPRRFRGPETRWPGGWTVAGRPTPWQPPPEDAAVVTGLRRHVADALAELPELQRTVVELRDVHGLTSDEVCERLELSPANQRVLLHRGRAGLRARLEDVYQEGENADDHA